jgi:hypothetical protein
MQRSNLTLAALAVIVLASHPAFADRLSLEKYSARSNRQKDTKADDNETPARSKGVSDWRDRWQQRIKQSSKLVPNPRTSTQPPRTKVQPLPIHQIVPIGPNRFAFRGGNRFELAIPGRLIQSSGGASPDELIDVDILCPAGVPVEAQVFAPGVRRPVATAKGLGSCKLSCPVRDLARGNGSCRLVLKLTANPADVKGTVTINRSKPFKPLILRPRPKGVDKGSPAKGNPNLRIRPRTDDPLPAPNQVDTRSRTTGVDQTAPAQPDVDAHRPEPPDSNSGSPETSGLPDLKVRAIELFRGQRNPITGAVTPDTSLSEIDLTSSHLTIAIDNCGLAAFNGEADLRIAALSSFSQGNCFCYDKTLPVSLSLGSGKHTQIRFPLAQSPWGRPSTPGESLEWGFVWRDPINHPNLAFGARIDARDKITESNEQNNFCQKEIAIPCGVRIDGVVGDGEIDLAFGHTLVLRGHFGERHACKQVYVERNGQRHRLDVKSWSNSRLHVYVLDRLSEGQYTAAVYTTGPSAQPAYRSNSVEFKIVRSEIPDDHLDARELANALYDEYRDWIKSPPKIENIWLEKLEGGLPNRYVVHCLYRHCGKHKTLCEIFKDGRKVFSLKLSHDNVPDEDPDQPGLKHARRQVVLQPGDYLVRFIVLQYDWEAQKDFVWAKMSWQLTAHP